MFMPSQIDISRCEQELSFLDFSLNNDMDTVLIMFNY
jgi:hypothetical protein